MLKQKFLRRFWVKTECKIAESLTCCFEFYLLLLSHLALSLEQLSTEGQTSAFAGLRALCSIRELPDYPLSLRSFPATPCSGREGDLDGSQSAPRGHFPQ